MAGRYFEQWRAGDLVIHEFRRTVTVTDDILFAAITHHTPDIQSDVEEAKSDDRCRAMVNGLFAFALMVGISVNDTTLGTSIANLGYDELAMPVAIFVGDTLRVETEVVNLRHSKSRTNAGVVTFRHRALNQRNEIVCECLRTVLLAKMDA